LKDTEGVQSSGEHFRPGSRLATKNDEPHEGPQRAYVRAINRTSGFGVTNDTFTVNRGCAGPKSQEAKKGCKKCLQHVEAYAENGEREGITTNWA